MVERGMLYNLAAAFDDNSLFSIACKHLCNFSAVYETTLFGFF